ncbi:MAG TPA: hypothetical protein VF479_03985 [Pseudolysinimonas sp.]
MARTPVPPPPEAVGAASPAPSDTALRIQILATEHWSLLASRSTTQSEVLTRIAMFLTFVSATLVSLALVGQATHFEGNFTLYVVAILSVAFLIGVLTQLRVVNASMEDLMYVVAMNRLRGEYARLVPGIESGFMSSMHDDQRGAQRTYYFFKPTLRWSHVPASSMVFIMVVNSALFGLLIATVIVIAGGMTVAASIGGLVAAIAYLGLWIWITGLPYLAAWKDHVPTSPTPEP